MATFIELKEQAEALMAEAEALMAQADPERKHEFASLIAEINDTLLERLVRISQKAAQS